MIHQLLALLPALLLAVQRASARTRPYQSYDFTHDLHDTGKKANAVVRAVRPGCVQEGFRIR